MKTVEDSTAASVRAGPAASKAGPAARATARRSAGLHPSPQNAADIAWHALHREACVPYRRAGRYAWHFARGKLGRDPVFRSLLERGQIPPGARIVDIGCGQGLLASLLRTADRFEAQGRWPDAWPDAPRATRYTGLELLPRDVRRAEAALAPEPVPLRATASFVCTDMVGAELPRCDVAVLLDVLHYIDHTAQERVLREVRRALVPGGRLLLRVADGSQRRVVAFTRWVDRTVAFLRHRRRVPLSVRPLSDWVALLHRLGYDVQSQPMSQGTPFANVLLIAERRVSA